MKAKDKSDRLWRKPSSQGPNFWAERGGSVPALRDWKPSTYKASHRTIGILYSTYSEILEDNPVFTITAFLKEHDFRPINHFCHDAQNVYLINFPTDVEAVRFKLTFPYECRSFSDFNPPS